MLSSQSNKSSAASGIAYAASKRRSAAVEAAPADIEAYVREALGIILDFKVILERAHDTRQSLTLKVYPRWHAYLLISNFELIQFQFRSQKHRHGMRTLRRA